MSDLHIVLVAPEIHWNAGNAGRTCLALGAQLHLVEPLGFSLAEREVRRAGLDYWERVAPTIWHDWETFARALPALGEPWLFATEAPRTLWQAPLAAPAVLVFGCESVGLPQALRERWADRLVRIPMAADSVRSLNLSTSVALAGYEVRRRGSPPWPAPPA